MSDQSNSSRVDPDDSEPQRITLDAERAPATIPSEVLHDLCRHALEVAPEECCGLVLGRDDEPFLRSVRITNIMTKKHLEDPVAFPRDALHAYYMSEVEYQRIIEEAEERSEIVRAIYHSHVEQGCYMSQDDLAFAVHPLFPFPEASQIVVSILGDGVDEIGIFDRSDEDSPHFTGRQLVAASKGEAP